MDTAEVVFIALFVLLWVIPEIRFQREYSKRKQSELEEKWKPE
jgi:hypothetical protein